MHVWCEDHPDIDRCRSQHNIGSLAINHLLCLSSESQPPCGIYQYCKVEISNNIYSTFQVSRSFKKVPLPNNGFGTLNSPGVTAVPLTWKKPRTRSLVSSQRYFCLCLRLYAHRREYIPETWLNVQFDSSSQRQTQSSPPSATQGHSLEWCRLKTVHNCQWNTQ